MSDHNKIEQARQRITQIEYSSEDELWSMARTLVAALGPSPCGVEEHYAYDWVPELHVTADEHECTSAGCVQAHCLACEREQRVRREVLEDLERWAVERGKHVPVTGDEFRLQIKERYSK